MLRAWISSQTRPLRRVPAATKHDQGRTNGVLWGYRTLGRRTVASECSMFNVECALIDHWTLDIDRILPSMPQVDDLDQVVERGNQRDDQRAINEDTNHD